MRDEQGLPHGLGRMVYANGVRYTGQWVHGQPHGKGMEERPDGDRYVGEWANGQPDGLGVHSFDSGARFESEFKAGAFCGHGVFEARGPGPPGLGPGWGTYSGVTLSSLLTCFDVPPLEQEEMDDYLYLFPNFLHT